MPRKLCTSSMDQQTPVPPTSSGRGTWHQSSPHNQQLLHVRLHTGGQAIHPPLSDSWWSYSCANHAPALLHRVYSLLSNKKGA